ncbi:unnamed protein product, partial [Closterium sp. NIES-54]
GASQLRRPSRRQNLRIALLLPLALLCISALHGASAGRRSKKTPRSPPPSAPPPPPPPSPPPPPPPDCSFADSLSDFALSGDALSATYKACPALTLTSDAALLAGGALNPSAIVLTDRASSAGGGCAPLAFSASFAFAVASAKNGASKAGQGVTFFVTANAAWEAGSDSGFLGWGETGDSPSFAVEFDTFKDTWDKATPHIGFNLNASVKSVTASKAAIPALSDATIKYVWIDYSPGTKQLTVFLNTAKNRPAKNTFVTNFDPCALFKASQNDPNSDTPLYMGFSASTGAKYYSAHTLLGFNVTASAAPAQTGGGAGGESGSGGAGSGDPSGGGGGASGGGNIQASPGVAMVRFYEQASLLGPIGLMLALQFQPVVVHVEADQDCFLNYNGFQPVFMHVEADQDCFLSNMGELGVVGCGGMRRTRTSPDPLHPPTTPSPFPSSPFPSSPSPPPQSNILTDKTCFANRMVNHVVVLVGYHLEEQGQAGSYFILRNSWGTTWGDNGHMRIGLDRSPFGYCGMWSEPGYYPMLPVQASAATRLCLLPYSLMSPPLPPCPPPSLPSAVPGKWCLGFPCGAGKCSDPPLPPKPGEKPKQFYSCDCTNEPFLIPAVNVDGTDTCIVSKCRVAEGVR